MIRLLEIAKSINEADRYGSKSIGKEDGDTWDTAKGRAGKYNGEIRYFDGDDADDAADEYAKTGKVDGEAGGADKKDTKVKGKAVSDFGRAADDEADDMDRDARFDADDDEDDEKNAPEKENEQIEKELQNIAKDKGLTVGSEDANYGGEIHSLVGKDDDPDNVLGFHAAPNFDDDGNMTDEPQYAIEIGMGSSPMYFGSKEEADAALKKLLDDEKIRKAMDGEGDETLFDLGDHAKSIADDAKKPESEKEKFDPKSDGPHQGGSHFDRNDMEVESSSELDDFVDKYEEKLNDEQRKKLEDIRKKIEAAEEEYKDDPGSLRDEITQYWGEIEDIADSTRLEISLNGKKYKPIKELKESNPRFLKENYDRIFRSLK